MSNKIVRYNGGTQSYYGCSDPAILVIGKVYEVISENDRGYQTDYTLKGVAGHFNSVWFDDVQSRKPTYMAVANTIPSVGKRCQCFKLEYANKEIKTIGWSTSMVQEVTPLGNNIYHVKTCNSVYIVQVG